MGAVHDNESIPVVFNALKHHLAFIRRFIEEADVTDLAFSLKPVGASQMDLYYGDLPQSSIFAQVIRKLEHDNLMERQKYNHWLTKTGGYATILLDDLSAWILRKSNDDIRFIHIHPARYSPYTIRVHANVLKTAIACSVCLNSGMIRHVGPGCVNYVRQEILKLPPMKRIREGDSLMKCMKLLSGR